MRTPTSDEVVAMINAAKTEQDDLKDKIRDLRLRQGTTAQWLDHLRETRNKMIIEDMSQEDVEATTVAIRYGVSRTWVWKLCGSQTENS